MDELPAPDDVPELVDVDPFQAVLPELKPVEPSFQLVLLPEPAVEPLLVHVVIPVLS
jgi:hypothetical protein